MPWSCPATTIELHWNCTGTALKLLWKSPTSIDDSQLTLKLHLKCSETALAATRAIRGVCCHSFTFQRRYGNAVGSVFEPQWFAEPDTIESIERNNNKLQRCFLLFPPRSRDLFFYVMASPASSLSFESRHPHFDYSIKTLNSINFDYYYSFELN